MTIKNRKPKPPRGGYYDWGCLDDYQDIPGFEGEIFNSKSQKLPRENTPTKIPPSDKKQ